MVTWIVQRRSRFGNTTKFLIQLSYLIHATYSIPRYALIKPCNLTTIYDILTI